MRHVRLFYPRPPRKTFEILLLLLASASVFFLVYVHYHMPPKVWKIKAENELYVVPGELLASGHVQRFNPKVVYEDFAKEHRGSLTKQDHGLLGNIMHKTTTTTLRVEGAFDLGSPEEETYLLHTTSAFSTIPGSYTRPGFLNHHVWEHICNFRVESLRESILFPNAPSRRSFLASFQTNGTSKNFGDRIFGYIHPDISGQYKFAVSSDDNSELWLSSDERSENLRKISNVGSWNESSPTMPGEYTKFPSQVSVNVNLTKGRKYFIELLHKQKSGMSHLEVAWQTPEESEFKIITSEYVSAFVDDRHVADNAVSVQDYTETPSQSRDSMPTVDRTELGAVLPSCPYEPSYLVKHKLVRFQGARNKSNTHFAAVYPSDNTNETLPFVKGEDTWWQEMNVGNALVDGKTAERVITLFMKALEQKHPGVFDLRKILSVEEVKDPMKGRRYLIDLDLIDKRTNTGVRASDYVYVHESDSNSICFPDGFQWHKRAVVHIIVPVKNGGRWALYFIRNIAEILQETKDQKVHVVIIDYESQDIDVESVLKESSISEYTVLKMAGEKEFRRSEALQRGSDAVKDPNSILFLCDLHLKIPGDLIELIRKHCIEGKMAFAPVVKRLRCGYYPKMPVGYWETLGFGLFAIYKSDFDNVGGMKTRKYSNWGGEDWDLLDEVLMSRMEVERLKIPNFYHFYHPPLNGNNQRVGA